MQQSYVNCSPSECLLTENIAGLMQSPLPSSAIKTKWYLHWQHGLLVHIHFKWQYPRGCMMPHWSQFWSTSESSLVSISATWVKSQSRTRSWALLSQSTCLLPTSWDLTPIWITAFGHQAGPQKLQLCCLHLRFLQIAFKYFRCISLLLSMTVQQY